jgi:acyl carrier protein
VRYAGVRHAVATVRHNAQGEPQIVAYWVGEDDVDPATLRDTLAAALPRYMLPSAIVRLEAFPVTPNGKLDRRALPAPPDDQPQADYTAPVDGVESAVAEIWAEVLGVERVGATDNFFELGGQSLKTLQIRSRLAQRFGVDVPLRAIFRNLTVREQARAVAEALDARVTPAAAIPRLPDAEAYALSHAQRRLWFMHQLDPADTTTTFSRRRRRGRSIRLRSSARGLVVARQPSLRTTFAAIGGSPCSARSPVAVRLPRVDLSAMSDSSAGRRSNACWPRRD